MTPAACCHGTAHEIAALTGHASLREIERYTRAADQADGAQRHGEDDGTRTNRDEKCQTRRGRSVKPVETID